MPEQLPVPRRTVLAAGAATAGMAALAGCRSGGSTADPDQDATTTPPTPDQSSPGGGGAPEPLIAVADVPVGGAASATGADGTPVVVAQPTAGEVVAFSAVCTHRQCTVAPAGAELHCPCHGSVYDAFTGEVLSGPAPAPLPEVAVTVQQGEVLPA